MKKENAKNIKNSIINELCRRYCLYGYESKGEFKSLNETLNFIRKTNFKELEKLKERVLQIRKSKIRRLDCYCFHRGFNSLAEILGEKTGEYAWHPYHYEPGWEPPSWQRFGEMVVYDVWHDKTYLQPDGGSVRREDYLDPLF